MGDLAIAADHAEVTMLAKLQRHAEQARGAFSPNTERALRADTAVFTGWCAARALPSLPAAADTLAGFVDAIADARAPATIRRYVSSVAACHRAAGLPSPADAAPVRLALRRLHRARGRAQVQASALTRPLVERLLAAAGAGPRDLRNRALLALAYDTLCRRAELVALDRADLELGADGAGTVTVRRSKADPEGAGQVRYIAADTVRDVRAWLAASGDADGPLFRSVGKSGAIGGRLDPGDVARVFKRMATAAGVPPPLAHRVSGHSTRIGAVQDMVRYGVELPAIMHAGGWQAPAMVARYAAKLDARRSGAAKLAMLQNR